MNDTWAVFIETNLPAAFKLTNADKKFLSLTAQKGVLAASEVSPLPQTSNFLISLTSTKSMVQAEFACRSLEVLVKTANPAIFHEQPHED